MLLPCEFEHGSQYITLPKIGISTDPVNPATLLVQGQTSSTLGRHYIWSHKEAIQRFGLAATAMARLARSVPQPYKTSVASATLG